MIEKNHEQEIIHFLECSKASQVTAIYKFIDLWTDARDWSLKPAEHAKGINRSGELVIKTDIPTAVTVERWDIIGLY